MRKVALPPYLMMEWNGPNVANDRWNEKQTPSILEAKIKGTMDHQMIDGVRNKSVSKKYIYVVGMEDIERSLPFTVDWKVALSKRNLSLF
jgi:hypothetical protein